MSASSHLRVAAVWVLFHQQHLQAQAMEALLRSACVVVVVDNRLAGSEPVTKPFGQWDVASSTSVHIINNHNLGGLAGAYNRAVQWLQHHWPDIDCVVFMDEDSDISALEPFLADRVVLEQLTSPGTAAVAPVPRDAATGLRSKPMQFTSVWRLRYLPRNFSGLQRVAFVINSMSVWRMKALQQLGPHDEGLGVDHIDTEYCLRANRASLRVYCHGDHSFAHRIGFRRRFSLLGVEMQAGGHSPERRYMIGRNTVWLARRSLFHEPGFALMCVLRLAYEASGILAVEQHRRAKLQALARGVLAGLRTQ